MYADQHGQVNKIIGVILAVIIGGVMVFAGIWVMGEFSEANPDPLEGTGTSSTFALSVENTATDTVDVGTYSEVKSASVAYEYGSNSDNVTIKVNSTTVLDKTGLSGPGTIENDVAGLVTEGSNELDVTVENSGGAVSDNATLDVKTYTESEAEKSAENAQEGVWDAIGMSPLLVTIAVIVGVLTILVGALATGKLSL